ncbi:hypothetical protein ACFL43_04765 [Thermodesulfobacteriota bacterium]
MTKFSVAFLLISTLLVTTSSISGAAEFITGRDCSVPEGAVIEGDLYAFCRSLTVDGTVTGDLILWCGYATITGTVQGDVIAFCRKVAIAGTVRGDVKAAVKDLRLEGVAENNVRIGWADRVFISGTVNNTVDVFCNYLSLAAESTVGQNVLFSCAALKLNGKIAGAVDGTASEAELNGKVEKDVEVRGLREASVSSGAHIKGDLKLTDGLISIAPQATIEGATIKNLKINKWTKSSFYIFKLIWLMAAILIGVLTIKLMPGLTQKVIAEIQHFWKSMATGCVSLLFFPVAIILVALTFVGLPLSLFSLALYISCVYLSTVYVGIAIGMVSLRVFKKPFHISLAAMTVGLLVLHSIFIVPCLGVVVRLVTVMLGLGMIVSGSLKFVRERT